jgi:hypothetical protein
MVNICSILCEFFYFFVAFIILIYTYILRVQVMYNLKF